MSIMRASLKQGPQRAGWMDSPDLSRKLYLRLLLFVGAISLFALFGAWCVESMTRRQQEDALVINLASRQRLLSQQLVTFAVLLQDTSDRRERERICVELKETLRRWMQVHDTLLSNKKLRFVKRDNTLRVRDVETHVLALRQSMGTLLDLSNRPDGPDREGMSRTLMAIHAHQPHYLSSMDRIIDECTREAANCVIAVRWTNGVTLVGTITLLVFIARFVYAPADHAMRRQIEDLRGAADARREKQELAKMNARLSESESRFRSLLDSTAEGIYGLDLQGNCTFANTACLRLLGYENVGDLLGRNMHDLIHHTRSDGTPYPVKECCIYQAFQEGKGTHVDSEVLWHADGSSFPAEYWSYPMYRDGHLVGSVVTFVDITERQKIQRALRESEAKALYGAVAEAAETDCLEDALESCIQRVCKLTGWPVGHAYVPARNQTVLEPTTIWHVDDGHDCAAFREVTERTTLAMGIGLPGRIWQSREPSWIANVQTDSNFPRAQMYEDINLRGAFGFPVIAQDQVVAILEFFTDVELEPDKGLLFTAASVGELLGRVIERQTANAEREACRLAADEANMAKSQFLASMSHELRTPLNGVIGMTELLSGTELSDKQQNFVNACRTSGESLLQLINNILDFSKIEAGKLELDLHDFDLEKLVMDTADTMSWLAADKHLELACNVDQMSQFVLKGDSCRLQQVLVNLIGNAIKFTEAGEVVVRAQIVGRHEERITVRFSVSDTGIGIPPDKLDRLFQSFSQIDASTTRQYGGTGLGLAISQGLVDLMGGAINVESESAAGSTFWFELPFVLVSETTEDTASDHSLAGRRILIVDDNETNRDILADYTAGWDGDAVTTATVDEALQAVERAEADGTPLHLVLTDDNMPGGSGLDLARALKDHPQNVVLLLSSAELDLDPDELRELGVDAILRKPLRRSELHDVMSGLLVSPRPVPKLNGNHPSGSADSTRLNGYVLLAEDNSINRLFVVELMKQIGCTCDTVSNGREATEAVQQRKYDLVLMDCQMPKMDGFEATRRIRQLESDGTLDGYLPIVALTANAINGDRERCLDAGMDDYLSKPAQADQIRTVLARALGHKYGREPQTLNEASPQDEAVQLPGRPPIAAEPLLTRCFGNLEFTNSLLDELESTGQERVDEIERQALEEDAAAMADTAHALKGAAGILCAESVQELAAQIEQAGRSSNVRNLDTQLRDLAAEMKRCLDYLPQLREELKTVKECV